MHFFKQKFFLENIYYIFTKQTNKGAMIIYKERLIQSALDFIEYQMQELDIEVLSELYPTIEERISFLADCETYFSHNIESKIKKGVKLYF